MSIPPSLPKPCVEERPTTTPAFFETPEMLAEIADYLSPKDLRAYMGVSRAFRAVAIRRVHRHITLPSAASSPNRDVIEECTTSVELEHHDHKCCGMSRPLDLPRLRTLIFHRNVVEEHAGQGSTADNYNIPLDFGFFACSEPSCVSGNLKPRRVVVRPFTTPARDKSVFFVPPTSSDTVIQLRRKGPYRYWHDLTASPETPLTGRNITVVLLPSFYGQFKSFMLAADSQTGSKSHDNDSLISSCLAPYVLANPQDSITIVGLEDANPFASQLHWSERKARGKEEEASFRAYLDRLMRGTQLHLDGTRGEAWDEADRAMRQATIHVRTTKDYFESGAWGEEMSPEVIGLWLNAYYAREEEDAELDMFRSQAPVVVPSCVAFPTTSRSTTRNRHTHTHSNSSTTLSIMADIAIKTRTILAPGRISIDGCLA